MEHVEWLKYRWKKTKEEIKIKDDNFDNPSYVVFMSQQNDSN